MKKLFLLLIVCGLFLTYSSLQAQSSDSYSWRNVEIVGGGFVPGIIYNETEPGLVYARTDIGGAYRMDNSTNRWVPLCDWIGWDDWGLTGIVSLATDPVEPDRLYLAAGTYTNSWDPKNGAILRSTDRGNSFEISPLPFKLGGNMPGRGMGERLAIDPNNNSILYLGGPSGHGLWRSTNYGQTWSKVTSFPTGGTYIDDPNDPGDYLTDIQGIVWVTFDKRTGSPGNTTQTIYVGVADLGNSVYRSTDGGLTWHAVPGQPTGFVPHKGKLDLVNGYLFVAYSDNGGPYGGEKGDVWRYNTATGVWTMISPIPSSSSDNYFGYSGLTLDLQKPGTLMVSGYSSWWPDTQFWRSTDSGNTWTRIWDWTRYPNRSFRYTMDISDAPWLYWGGAQSGGGRPGAEVYPKLGWMTESLEIDPFNSDKMMYGTGATIFGTDNLTEWDRGGKILIKVKAMGLEETAIQELVSPPSGPQLISGMYDIYGFTHHNLDVVPQEFFSNPRVATLSIDYAELSPGYIFRVGEGNASEGLKSAGYSTNGGSSWTEVRSQPSGVNRGGGTCAVNANGTRVLWSPSDAGVFLTTNNGRSWTASSGIPAGAIVKSDRVNSNKFYGFKDGIFYVSTNGGASFTATSASGLPANAQFKAVQGREGHIWLAGYETGIWRSTNSGASFTNLGNVDEADNIGFGKAAPGKNYMALYSSANVNGQRGIYRSIDEGVTWERINDDDHQYAWTGKAITGDPRIYGRVYIATNGRGIIYGDITSAQTMEASSMVLLSDPENSELIVSPNPLVGNELAIHFSGEITSGMKVLVTDFAGHLIYQKSLSKNDFEGTNTAITFPGKLSKGIYVLNLTNGKVHYSTKFIVE